MPLFMQRPVNPSVVEAIQLPPGAQASPTRGRSPRPGDWFVTDHSTGESYSMTPDEFANAFIPLSVPSSVLAAEHQAQQEQAIAAGQTVYQPQVQYDPTRSPGFTGRTESRGTAVTASGEVVPGEESMSKSPAYAGAGDAAPLDQPMTESLSGRPSPTPEVRPRLGDMGEDAPVDTPTGLPSQPGDADKAAAEQSPTGQ